MAIKTVCQALAIFVISLALSLEAWSYNTEPNNFDAAGKMAPHPLLTKATLNIFLKLLESQPNSILPPGLTLQSDAVKTLKANLNSCDNLANDLVGCQNMVVWGVLQEDGDLGARQIMSSTRRKLEQIPYDFRDAEGQPLQGEKLQEAQRLTKNLETKAFTELENEFKAMEARGLVKPLFRATIY